MRHAVDSQQYGALLDCHVPLNRIEDAYWLFEERWSDKSGCILPGCATIVVGGRLMLLESFRYIEVEESLLVYCILTQI